MGAAIEYAVLYLKVNINIKYSSQVGCSLKKVVLVVASRGNVARPVPHMLLFSPF